MTDSILYAFVHCFDASAPRTTQQA